MDNDIFAAVGQILVALCQKQRGNSGLLSGIIDEALQKLAVQKLRIIHKDYKMRQGRPLFILLLESRLQNLGHLVADIAQLPLIARDQPGLLILQPDMGQPSGKIPVFGPSLGLVKNDDQLHIGIAMICRDLGNHIFADCIGPLFSASPDDSKTASFPNGDADRHACQPLVGVPDQGRLFCQIVPDQGKSLLRDLNRHLKGYRTCAQPHPEEILLPLIVVPESHLILAEAAAFPAGQIGIQKNPAVLFVFFPDGFGDLDEIIAIGIVAKLGLLLLFLSRIADIGQRPEDT